MEELIVKERIFKEELAKLINNYGMPAFLVRNILNEFSRELQDVAQNEYDNAVSTLQQRADIEEKAKAEIEAESKEKTEEVDKIGEVSEEVENKSMEKENIEVVADETKNNQNKKKRMK